MSCCVVWMSQLMPGETQSWWWKEHQNPGLCLEYLNFVQVLLNLALFSCRSFLIRFLIILSDFFHRLFFRPWIDPMRCQATFGPLRFAKPATSPVPTSCTRQSASRGAELRLGGESIQIAARPADRSPAPSNCRQVRKLEAVCHTSVSRPQGPASARQGGYWRRGLSVSRPRPGEAGPARRARSSARESCRLQSPRPPRLFVRRRRSRR